jgi:hypothetical protein
MAAAKAASLQVSARGNGEPRRFCVIERQIVDSQVANARADCARGRRPTIRQGKPGVFATARDLKCESSEPRIRCRALDRHTRCGKSSEERLANAGLTVGDDSRRFGSLRLALR